MPGALKTSYHETLANSGLFGRGYLIIRLLDWSWNIPVLPQKHREGFVGAHSRAPYPAAFCVFCGLLCFPALLPNTAGGALAKAASLFGRPCCSSTRDGDFHHLALGVQRDAQHVAMLGTAGGDFFAHHDHFARQAFFALALAFGCGAQPGFG